MQHKQNETLGVSFDLPDQLTVDELDEYQVAMQNAIARLNGKSSGPAGLTDARYYAVVYGVAVERGLISNWQCTSQPDLSPANVGKADAKAIYWTGKTIRRFIQGITEIPPA